jgi:hypothetical protein
MEKPACTRANLFGIRVIMSIMRLLAEELICQTVTRQISVHVCLSVRARGRMQLRPIIPGIKCHFIPRTRL